MTFRAMRSSIFCLVALLFLMRVHLGAEELHRQHLPTLRQMEARQ